MDQKPGRPPLEVADIFRTHGAEYLRRHTPSAAQRRVMKHITECRTAALGGHRDRCQDCGQVVRLSYNSCRDRHCPKCQNLKKAQWLKTRCERLLPVPYFHVTFTLPDELNPLTLRNKRFIYNLLFDTAAATLKKIARDPEHLGAQVGFTAILHTWGQKLQLHPHLHCVVTGGGLSADGKRWIAARRRDFFLPVKVLASLFQKNFLRKLKAAYREGKLDLSGSTAPLREPTVWRTLIKGLYASKWVVDARPPFGGPEHVFRYLGRYTHRVAISNHRLLSLEGDTVTFLIKDYADGGKKKTFSLDAVEFMRRFLLHIIPRSFIRIRHYGLLAGRNVTTKLLQARLLLGQEIPQPAPSPGDSNRTPTWSERLLQLTGIDILACPLCRTGRLVREPIPPDPGCRVSFLSTRVSFSNTS